MIYPKVDLLTHEISGPRDRQTDRQTDGGTDGTGDFVLDVTGILSNYLSISLSSPHSLYQNTGKSMTGMVGKGEAKDPPDWTLTTLDAR